MAVMTVTAVNAQTRINYVAFRGIVPPQYTLEHQALAINYIGETITLYNSNLQPVHTIVAPLLITGGMPLQNYDEGRIDYDYDITVTQTLFNNDANYEYFVRSSDNSSIMVKTDAGTTLYTLNLDPGYVMDGWAAYLFGEKIYVTIAEYSEDDDYYGYITYRFNIQSQSISRVDGYIPISVSPSVADRDQTITVELGEGNNATEVQVVNAVGQVVKSIAVQPGQREVQLHASDLGSGMHVVGTRSRKGQGACKIIVK